MSSLACTENVSLMLRGSTSYSYLKIKNWHQSNYIFLYFFFKIITSGIIFNIYIVDNSLIIVCYLGS